LGEARQATRNGRFERSRAPTSTAERRPCTRPSGSLHARVWSEKSSTRKFTETGNRRRPGRGAAGMPSGRGPASGSTAMRRPPLAAGPRSPARGAGYGTSARTASLAPAAPSMGRCPPRWQRRRANPDRHRVRLEHPRGRRRARTSWRYPAGSWRYVATEHGPRRSTLDTERSSPAPAAHRRKVHAK